MVDKNKMENLNLDPISETLERIRCQAECAQKMLACLEENRAGEKLLHDCDGEMRKCVMGCKPIPSAQ